MNFTEPAAVFQIVNTMALPGWLWLVIWLFLPKAVRHSTRFVGLLLPLMLALFYAASMMVHFSAAEGGFDSLDGVLSLFTHPGAALGGWVHYLSFDLFVGWCISRHAIHRSANRVLVVFCLFFTFMLGPVGILLYGAIITARHIVVTVAGRSEPTEKLWRQVAGGQPAMAQCGIFLMFLLPVFGLALLMDTRTVLELNVWIKPLKFSFALIVYLLTLSWYSNFLPGTWRDNRWFSGFSVVVVTAVVLEMVWLVYAASIGEPSHFNRGHPVLAPVYPMMGVIAVILTLQSLVIGVGVLRGQWLSDITRYSLSYGLIATFILTVLSAGYMSSAPAQTHAVLPDGVVSAAMKDTGPLVGWLRSAGDLRVAHFFSTHALHFIPLVGWLVSAVVSNRAAVARPRLIAAGISVVYCVGVLGVFLQAIGGKPFL